MSLGWKRHQSVACTMSLILGAVFAQNAGAQTAPAEQAVEEIVVTGIRGSLKRAMDEKRDAQGVVDAISSEDMGKFPDTNLAESLQRITGVSIDRANGEGARVTVRGFGPDYNLVTLNGRQMPTAGLEATTASSSRSFDFGNLAAEGISGVQVYKTSRANTPTGGIGSTINISTTRPLDAPGMKASVGAKGVYDTSSNEKTKITPELSGIYSNTFADDTFGIALTGSYQDRKSGFNQVSTPDGWRGAYRGSDNNWGTLPTTGVTNRPGPNDVYAVQQSINYSLNEIRRERINGQATLQYRPTDTLTATLDYTFAQQAVRTERSDVSAWFNFGDTSSEWTDGPVAGPVFYTERFAAGDKDLSMGGALFASKNVNHSMGANLEWEPTENLRLELDAHDSSAVSKPDSKYGSNNVIGTAGFYLARQSVNYTNDIPVLSIGLRPGLTQIDPSRQTTTGSSFRNSYMRNDLQQVRLDGDYDIDRGWLTKVDFGVSFSESKVRSAFANAQRDTWGGAGPASDIPDDIFVRTSLPDKFNHFKGSKDPNLIQEFFTFDFERMADLIDRLYNACGGDGVCRSDDYSTDRRTRERSTSGYVQLNNEFDFVGRPAHLTAGLRYENTKVRSRALVPIATGTQWVAANEFAIIFSSQQDFTELTGKYDLWLPSVDFDVEVVDDVVFRASYSQSVTRPGYADIQGGQTVSQLFRVDGGTGSQGDPGLKPFASDNYDASLEWYYDDASYISAGYFRKDVKNFIGVSEIRDTPFNLPHPFGGARYNAAVAALGPNAPLTAIRNYIFQNAPAGTVRIDGRDSAGNITGAIFGVPGDPLVPFRITVPVNQRNATVDGWEFAVQHTFWESGFGVIVNYTMVDGDVKFDNTQPASVTQFALVGLSDSANLVGFYDKDGIQVRVAYNWRDKFLASTATAGGPNNPLYVESFGQWDVQASYDVTDQMTVFLEGINVTDETNRVHGRHPNEANYVTQTGARYMAGARYKF